MKSGLIKFIEGNAKIEQEWDELEKNNPPEKMDVKKIILKKEGDPITIKQFKAYLARIKWDTWPRGCEHYIIFNHKNQRTNLGVRKYGDNNVELELIWEELMFGCDYGGIFKVFLKDAEITISDMGYIWLTFGQFTLHLANHDNHLAKSEEYLRSLSKDFQGRLFCCECKALQTSTYKRSALYIQLNSFKISLGRGFGSPTKCPKCGYSSFGDMNIHTDLKYYNVKTNRIVSMDKIEKMAKEQKVEYDKLIKEEKEEEKRVKEQKIIDEENQKKKDENFVRNIRDIGVSVK